MRVSATLILMNTNLAFMKKYPRPGRNLPRLLQLHPPKLMINIHGGVKTGILGDQTGGVQGMVSGPGIRIERITKEHLS